MNKQSFGSIGSLGLWSKDIIRYVDNDNSLPYVLKDKQFYYFTFDGQKYNLAMVSEKDIMTRKI